MMKIFCISLILINIWYLNFFALLLNFTIDKIPIMPLFVFIFFFNMLYKYKACCRAYSCRSCVYADVWGLRRRIFIRSVGSVGSVGGIGSSGSRSGCVWLFCEDVYKRQDIDRAVLVAPVLRMLYSDGTSEAVVKFECSRALLDYDTSVKSLTPDHIVYTKASQLVLSSDVCEEGIISEFKAFTEKNGYKPRIVIVKGLGIFACGKDVYKRQGEYRSEQK